MIFVYNANVIATVKYNNCLLYTSRILDTPAPIIVLGSLSASSVDITVRVGLKQLITGMFYMILMRLFIRHLIKKESDSLSHNLLSVSYTHLDVYKRQRMRY